MSRRHPEPDGRLEGHHGVGRHQVRPPHQVQPQRVPGSPVVVLVSELHGASPVVLIAGRAPLLHPAVTCAHGHKGRRGDHTGGLVGGLREEGGELPAAGGLVAGGAEAAERARGLHERVVGVEEGAPVAPAVAAAVVALPQHGVERVPRDDRRHAAARGDGRGQQQRRAGESEQPKNPHAPHT
uniref:Uncharacterized protein n=1 Tax=Triticum urartu TaxID=4572 RepID=A0A8R7QKH1_TRIUA